MSSLTIQGVSTGRQKKQFLDLPATLYGDDPNWVPQIRDEEKHLAGFARHPFYETNQIQTFLAYRGSQVCGRIGAIHNQGHIDFQGERRGFFGFFECVDDQQVADALFDAARGWLSERDVHCLRGPTNPAIHYSLGTLIDGFDSPPTFLMPYNPKYYPRLIEGAGFVKAQDLFAFYGCLDMLPASSEKLEPISEQIIQRYGIQVRDLDKSNFLADVEMFLSLYNRSMEQHWSFSPISQDEIKQMAKGLRQLMVPELAVVATIDDKPVGAVFCLPDYNPRVKAIRGRLFPFGFIRLLWRKHRIKKIRTVAVNVIPECQLLGVGLVLLRALVPKALENGLDEVEFSWVAESNRLSRGSLEKGGARLIKTYRVYDWDPQG